MTLPALRSAPSMKTASATVPIHQGYLAKSCFRVDQLMPFLLLNSTAAISPGYTISTCSTLL